MIEISASTRVVIRTPNALGDTVMSTPAIRRIAEVVPPANLTLVGVPVSIETLAGNPWAGESIVYDRRGAHRGALGFWRFSRGLAECAFDLAVIFPNSFSSALMFSLAHVAGRIGYRKEGRGVLLTEGLKRPQDEQGKFAPRYTGEYFGALTDLLGGLPPIRMWPELHIDEQGEAECRAWMRASGLAQGERFFIVAPGAAFGPSKVWLPERYAQVSDELARARGARCLVSYGPGEEDIAGAVKTRLAIPPLPDARLSLRGLKSLYARAAFVLTNDTGPRHLAVAFGIPHITIMGPNDPAYTYLPGEPGEVMRETVECSPCQLKVCPRAEKICMTQLSVERVLAACLRHFPDS